MTPSQRNIVLRWLEAGEIDGGELEELEPNLYEYENYSDEELTEENKRLMKLIGAHYCNRMKDIGKCGLCPNKTQPGLLGSESYA